MATKAGTITIELVGDKRMAKRLKKLRKTDQQALGSALFIEGEGIMADSKMKYVPVDKGHLRSSGHVSPPRAPGPQVWLGFGGATVDYAIHVHERLRPRHPVGQAKYLERPMLEHIPGMGKRIARNLERWLNRHGAK